MAALETRLAAALGDQRPEGGGQKSEVGSQRSEVRNQEGEARSRKPEIEEEAPAARAEPAPAENSWPSEAEEAAFLADQRAQGVVVPVQPAAGAGGETDSQPLPSLDELVQRIPAETRAALDDLFRAKFTNVRRVPKKALKT